MSKALLNTGILVALLLAATAAAAGDIYKYTDADGNVHYRDRPTGDPTEQRVAIASRGTDPASIQARIDARKEREAAREEARSARAEEEAAEADARQAVADRAAKCEEHRLRLQTYNESRRLYREDETGERVYLDDAERAEAESEVRKMIDEFCG